MLHSGKSQRTIRLPMVMHRGPGAMVKNTGILHRLVAALGMHVLLRQPGGAGDMEPMEFPLHPEPGLIHMQHLAVT